MPSKPPSPCPEPGCRNLKPCSVHVQKPWQRPYATRQSRGYDAKHDRLRARVLREEPICMACHRKASRNSDHIVPLSRRGTTERSNLQGLCDDCHKAKTIRERGRGR
jgi:5-methylcytosine-specific restriction enzyme A